MSKLLSAEFVRLFKSFIFRLGLLFSAGLGAFAVLMRYCQVKKDSSLYAQLPVEYRNADGLIFVGALYIMFAVAVFIGIFVGTEYSDGTIRNKIATGHTRSSIYISKLIVCAAADVMMHVLYILVVLFLGNLFIGGTTMKVTEILAFTAASITALLALTSLLLLFSMLIQSKAVGSIVCLLTTIIMLFATLIIWQRLDAPEYYDAYEYINQETGETISVEEEKNPNYLTGTKREVYEFLNDFISSSQMYQVAMNLSDNLKMIVIYDFVIIIVMSGAGMIIFKKMNLK